MADPKPEVTADQFRAAGVPKKKRSLEELMQRLDAEAAGAAQDIQAAPAVTPEPERLLPASAADRPDYLETAPRRLPQHLEQYQIVFEVARDNARLAGVHPADVDRVAVSDMVSAGIIDPRDERTILEDPGWGESLARAVLPRVTASDNRPLSISERLQAMAAATPAWAMDSFPPLRAAEALGVPQGVQKLGEAIEQSETGLSGIPGKVEAGLRRGVGRAVSALVPDRLAEGLDAGKSTGEAMTGIKVPNPIEELETIAELPAMAGRELRAASQADAAKAADNVLPNALDVLDPLRAAGPAAAESIANKLDTLTELGKAPAKELRLAGLLRAATPIREEDVPGMAIEGPLLSAMRVIGTAGEAATLEVGKRLPVPMTKAGGERLGLRDDLRQPLDEDATLIDRLVFELEPVTAGELVGAPQGLTQRVRRDESTNWFDAMVPAPIRNTMQATLERIERGEGMEEEGQAIATQLGGKEWAKTGYGVGMAASMVTPFETPWANAAGKMVTLSQKAAAMGRLSDAGKLKRLGMALTMPIEQFAETSGRQLSERVERRTLRVTELPDDIKPIAQALARDQFGMTLEEVALDEGLLDVASLPKDVAGLQRAEALFKSGAGAPATGPVDVRAADIEPNLKSPGNLYVLKNAMQEPVFMARTLDEVFREMVRRSDRGDVVWRSGITPIADWGQPVQGLVKQGPGEMVDMGPGVPSKAPPPPGPKGFGDEAFDATVTPAPAPPGSPKASKRLPSDASNVGRIRRLVGAEGADAFTIEHFAKELTPEPVPLRDLFDPDAIAAGRVASDLQYGFRTRPGGPATNTGRIIEDAARLWARNTYGSEYLTYLPTGSRVSLADHKRIMGAVKKDFADMGLDLMSKEVLDADPGDAERVAAKFRMKSVPDLSTPAGVREAIQAATVYHGGALAKMKGVVQGTPGLAMQVRNWLATYATGSTNASELARKWRPLVGGITEKFFADDLAGAPKEVRDIEMRGKARLERIPDDLAGQMAELLQARRKFKALPWWEALTADDLAEVYQTIFRQELVVQAEHATLAQKVAAGGLRGKKGRALDLRDELLNLDPEALPEWARTSDDIGKVAVALVQWSNKVRRDMVVSAREYLTAALRSGGVQVVRDSSVWNWVRNVPEDTMIALYTGVFLQGNMKDQGTIKVLLDQMRSEVDAIRGGVKYDPNAAMAAYIVMGRHKAVQREMLEELIQSGAAVVDDEMWIRSAQGATELAHTLDAVRTGNAYITGPNGQRVSTLPPAATAWAEKTLRMMGVEVGADVSFVPVRAGDERRIIVASHLAERMESMLTAGQISAGAMAGTFTVPTPEGFVDDVVRMWKKHTLAMSYAMVPRPHYAAGQAIGLASSLLLSRDLPEVLAALPTIGAATARVPGLKPLTDAVMPHLHDPLLTGMAGELVKRLAKPDPLVVGEAPNPKFSVLVDRNGMPWTRDELERQARDHGLADTIVKFEVADHLNRMVLAEVNPYGRVLFGAKGWQDMWLEWFGGFDQAVRLHLFLNDVRRGIPAAEAARAARKSTLDFRDLTDWEARWMRKAITFYAFQRKAADQFVTALFTNPERVGRAMRISHKLWTVPREDAQERGSSAWTRDQDVGRLWAMWSAEHIARTSKGELNPRYSWVATTPPVLPSENLRALGMFFSPTALLESSSPLIDSLAILAGYKGGRDITTDRANVMPAIVAQVTPSFLVSSFGIHPVPCDSDALRMDPIDHDPSATEALNGTPAVWVVGAHPGMTETERGAARRAWQEFQLWMLSTAPANLEGAGRAVGLREAQFERTWADETIWFTGLGWRKQPSENEAIEQFRYEQEDQFRDAAKEQSDRSLRKPAPFR